MSQFVFQHDGRAGGRGRGRALLVAALVVSSTAPAAAAPIFMGLGDLPGGGISSFANAVSGDGTTVVGNSGSANGTEAFRWTQATGIMPLGDIAGGNFSSSATGVSGDGSVVAGFGQAAGSEGSTLRPFRWTQATGIENLGLLPGGSIGGNRGEAWGVSADGAVVVGRSDTDAGFQAFRYAPIGSPPVETMQGLGGVEPPRTPFSQAFAASADGSVIVGDDRGTSTHFNHAFVWTQAGGMQDLHGTLPGAPFQSTAATVSGDGLVVAGKSDIAGAPAEGFRWTAASVDRLPGFLPDDANANGSVLVGLGIGGVTGAAVWDPVNGVRSVQDLLTAGGLDLTGWTLTSATGVSDSGKIIVGNARNPDGRTEAWIANLDPGNTVPLYLDWNTAPSKHLETIVDQSTGRETLVLLPGAGAPLEFPAGFDAAAFKAGVEQRLSDIFAASGLDLVLLDSPDPDVLTVRFGAELVIDTNGDGVPDTPIKGAAIDVLPAGLPRVGVDQFNLRPGGEVAIFVDPFDPAEQIAETVAHESGHGFGLRHIDPTASAEEVMDYQSVPGDVEHFWNDLANIVEPPDAGGAVSPVLHNPMYHLRRYVLGEDPNALADAGVPAGGWDQNPSNLLTLGLNQVGGLSLGDTLYNVALFADPGAFAAEPALISLAFFETLDLAAFAGLDLLLFADFPVRLMASSAPGGDFDLFFGFGDPLAPDLYFRNLIEGLLEGSIFQHIGGGLFDVVGRFSANVTFAGQVTSAGVQFAAAGVPEPAALALFVVGLAGLGFVRRRHRGPGLN